MKKIFVDIYLAFNLGDDLFLDVLAKRYKNAEITINYLGSNYNCFLSNYSNVSKRKYSMLNKFANRIKVTNYITNYSSIAESHDVLIFLGGSIFREEHYHEALYTERLNMVNEFNKRGKPVFVLGANFGPYRTDKFLNDYIKFFKKCQDVCFRDKYSFGKFQQLPNVRYAPDIVFQKEVKEFKKDIKENKIGYSIIDVRHKSGLEKYYKSYIDSTIKSIEFFTKKGYECCLMSFCEKEGDLDTIKYITSLLSPQTLRRVLIFDYHGDIDEAMEKIASFKLLIAARFHANILGLLLKISVLPIIYSSKTSNMLKDISFEGTIVNMDNLHLLNNELILCQSMNFKSDLNLISHEAENQFKKLDDLFTLQVSK